MPSTTVAPEYARYQAWHVAQDLSTQLRSTLATSAVFQGLGMGSGNAATALAATVAWLSRDASGMVASLAATARLAPRLDGDCRRWRCLGDVCVDAALVIELATPHAGRKHAAQRRKQLAESAPMSAATLTSAQAAGRRLEEAA